MKWIDWQASSCSIATRLLLLALLLGLVIGGVVGFGIVAGIIHN